MFIGLCDPWLGSSRCEGGNGVGLERRTETEPERGHVCVCVRARACVCLSLRMCVCLFLWPRARELVLCSPVHVSVSIYLQPLSLPLCVSLARSLSVDEYRFFWSSLLFLPASLQGQLTL